jgi:hypothetical protein
MISLRKFLTYPFLFLIAIIISLSLSHFTGAFYNIFFPISSINIGDIGMNTATTSVILGFSLNYIFFLSLLFTLFGGSSKYKFISLFCLPYFLLVFAWLPGLLFLLGYILIAVLGCTLSVGIRKLTPAFMAKIS